MDKKSLYPIVLVIFAVVGGGVGLLIGSNRAAPAGPIPAEPVSSGTGASNTDRTDNPYSRFEIADFALTNQDADPVTHEVFEGEVTVLSFFFASCPDPCPAIQRVMSDIQNRTEDSRVRLASVSVDGTHDSPERIRNYGLGFDADFDRWTFMTGDPTDVAAFARDSFSFEMRDQDDLVITRPDGTQRAQILHPTRLILIGPDRKAIGLYAYNDPEAVEDLVRDAAAAAG